MPTYEVDQTMVEQPLTVSLRLTAESGWRVGGGGGEDTLGLQGERSPDVFPVSERRICWQNHKASLSKCCALMPATAIKGALAHRVAFHYRCLSAHWVNNGDELTDTSDCAAVKELFGAVSSGEEDGQIGRVLMDDLMLEQARITTQMHNRIDRFTGGVMNGGLFEEALLWQTEVDLTLSVLELPGQKPISPLSRKALQLTLSDLAAGWLPLGAGGSRGQGVFTANDGLVWSDGGEWVQQSSEQREPV